jgi:hypothetical protein
VIYAEQRKVILKVSLLMASYIIVAIFDKTRSLLNLALQIFSLLVFLFIDAQILSILDRVVKIH